MGKYIMRKQLTPEQYQMANKTMSIILAVCYIAYIGTEISNMNKGTAAPFGGVRCGIYIFFMIMNFVMNKLKGDKKVCMLYYCVAFLIPYMFLIMNNGVTSMTLAFPALIGWDRMPPYGLL